MQQNLSGKNRQRVLSIIMIQMLYQAASFNLS